MNPFNHNRQPRQSELNVHDLAHAHTLALQNPHWQAGNERLIIRAAIAVLNNVRSCIPISRAETAQPL